MIETMYMVMYLYIYHIIHIYIHETYIFIRKRAWYANEH